ncbi:hypothetical protein [Nocardia sp. NBC_00511]|uniref:hypothetical protein n=1 Tax=Nocardia sp. NBC_00511 TaxID=2903591 RepID=UPI0030E5C935
MSVTWITFERYASPWERWKAIDDFTASSEIAVVEYRGDEHSSSLTACFGFVRRREYADIAFGTVNYRQVRYAAEREEVTRADTLVVYAYGRQVGQSYGNAGPHPEDLIERARELIAG